MLANFEFALVLSTCLTLASSWRCLPNLLPHQRQIPKEVIKLPGCMLNVRTVIFNRLDTEKPCWTADELQLLVARRVMQNLIPTTVPRNFKLLFKFIGRAEHVIRCNLASPHKLKMFFTAFYDVIGGYIHSVVMAILDEAYYAGNVDYQTAKNFHELLRRIKGFLDTDGGSWAAPGDSSTIPTKVRPLPLHICRVEESCRSFVKPLGNKSTSKIEAEAIASRHFRPDRSVKKSPGWNRCLKGVSKIPVPYLDDDKVPGAIAVPLKEHALFSLFSAKAINVLPKYYILAMRCLRSPTYSYTDIVQFNIVFHKWIVKEVMPHLYDRETWYPAFGGVMRVVETMHRRGLASNEAPVVETTCEPSSSNGSSGAGEDQQSSGDSTSFIILGLVGLVILVAVIALVVYLLSKKKSTEEKSEPPATAIEPSESKEKSGEIEGDDDDDEDYD